MSWETHEAAKRIADGWYAELEDTRKRNAVLGRENARLRMELDSVGTAAYLYGRSDLKAENAKLRSICAEVAGILFNLDVDYCSLCDRDNINHPCPVHTVKGGECLIESELRELGIEVGEAGGD